MRSSTSKQPKDHTSLAAVGGGKDFRLQVLLSICEGNCVSGCKCTCRCEFLLESCPCSRCVPVPVPVPVVGVVWKSTPWESNSVEKQSLPSDRVVEGGKGFNKGDFGLIGGTVAIEEDATVKHNISGLCIASVPLDEPAGKLTIQMIYRKREAEINEEKKREIERVCVFVCEREREREREKDVDSVVVV